jgi:beta-galactosidase
MGKFKLLVLFFIALQYSVFPQIKIKELPPYNLEYIDSSFFEISKSRKLKHLREEWQVYTESNTDKKVKVSVPSIFDGENSLFYQKSFLLSQEDISNNDITLNFLGLNYSAEILLNELLIYKHTGGEFPFQIYLDSTFLLVGENQLTLKVNFELDSESTIPLNQSFLFPVNRGGITRDVYLKFLPKVRFEISKFHYEFDSKFASAEVMCTVRTFISDTLRRMRDEENKRLSTDLLVEFWHKQDTSAIYSRKRKLNFNKDNSAISTFRFRLRSPKIWSLNSPEQYSLRIYLTHGENLIDVIDKNVSLFTLENSEDDLYLNNEKINIEGTTYIYSDDDYGALVAYDRLERDLKLIKQTGFNSIRFAKQLPHPYALKLCKDLGLFAFIEIPLNSLPESFAEDLSTFQRAQVYLHHTIEAYSRYESVLAFGVGSSYLSNSTVHRDFISKLSKEIKLKSDKFTYASFIGFPQSKIENLDFYGIEIFSTSNTNVEDYLSKRHTAKLKNTFISELTYPVFNGESNGYLNTNTYEAQAKQFERLMNFYAQDSLAGFFLNTFSDYNGKFPSFYAGFNADAKYILGITGADRGSNRLSFKAVSSKLNNSEKVTIPIGTRTDDSPVLFILTGLILSLLTALLINSKKKFRQDATRALIRPYNFFADIRDHRILSGVHTVILMFILAAAHSLLITNLLYFLRTNILLEKLLLALGKISIMNVIGHLAWNPVDALIAMFIFSILFFLLITITIKLFSLFLRTRVFYSNIFFVVIWSLLPLALLLPLELVLYKVLEANVINIYIYAVLGRMLFGCYCVC